MVADPQRTATYWPSELLWRKTSYGTQTDDGDRAVERLLAIRETCRLQRRRLHTYLPGAITAHQHGQPFPTPLLA